MAEPASPKIKFISDHKPVMHDGEYRILVNQEVKHDKIPKNFSIPPKTATFWVAGEQYSLNPQDISQVFPPAGSIADHSNVFPHIVLNRSTLPWERINGSSNVNQPWLALLLFTETEMKEIIEEVSTIGGAGFRENKEIGQSLKDKLRLITVLKQTIQKVMPTAEELNYLTHVRQGTDEKGKPAGNENAVVICNRLPKKGEESTVHLVSIENCFSGDKFVGKEVDGKIQLVSFKSWKFSCPDHYKITQEALDRLSNKTQAAQLQALEGKEYYKKEDIQSAFDSLSVPCDEELLKKFYFGTFIQTLLHLNRNPSTLRQPDKKIDENNSHKPAVDSVNSYFQAGLVPVKHHFRKGAKSVSWYHSPLATGKHSESGFDFPAKASDQLLRYDPDSGMFDVSYAAAWELGRLLALANKRFSTELSQWKRRHTHDIRAGEQMVIHDSGHLPSNPSGNPSLDLPKTVQKGFEDLSLLKGVPFNYLVPEEAMLPVESMRFFYIDELWMDCLLDGAFSIGRVTYADYAHDVDRKKNISSDYPTRTGFIMRSDVISGWPDMAIEGYSGDSKSETLLDLHQTRLSENVVLCIFEGGIDLVVMHLKPETIHFGVDFDGDKYFKGLRPKDSESGTIKKTVPFKNIADRVVDIKSLYGDIGSPNSAQFAYQMVEGVEKVVFRKKGGGKP
jgi:hypothetical protein